MSFDVSFLDVDLAQFKKSDKQMERDRRKQAKHHLTEQETEEIKECFKLFDTTNAGQIQTKEFKVALQAVGFTLSKEEREKLLTSHGLSLNFGETMTFDQFFMIMKGLYEGRDQDEEFEKCFKLFDNSGIGEITFADVKRVAKELGENMTDEELKEMIDETCKPGTDKIDQMDFFKIMQQSKLFSHFNEPLPKK